MDPVKWGRRLERARLPIGIALAVLFLVRAWFLLAGVEEPRPSTILPMVINAAAAAWFIWGGLTSPRDATSRGSRRDRGEGR